jgi:hypothetical protein
MIRVKAPHSFEVWLRMWMDGSGGMDGHVA